MADALSSTMARTFLRSVHWVAKRFRYDPHVTAMSHQDMVLRLWTPPPGKLSIRSCFSAALPSRNG